MIYTITCNPSLDYLMQLPSVTLGKTNRSLDERIYVGGKGFNVSTILHRLHLPTYAYGFVAGFSGQEIKRLLQQRGFPFELIEVSDGFSRINVKLKGELETEVNGSGPMLSKKEIEQLYKQIKQLEKDDILVISGSLPKNVSKHFYADIMQVLSSINCKVVVDAAGDVLTHVLPYHPFLIKPNQAELEDIFHCSIECEEDILFYGRKLQEAGAKNVLISLAEKGAILIDEDRHIYQSSCAKGIVRNSVGAGDSMVAGFLAGYQRYNCYQEALRLGTAAGCATAFHDDLASEHQIMDLVTMISVEEIMVP